jgi:DNA-binding response OmpR family regulator
MDQKKVLIVEDEATSRKIITLAIQKLGYKLLYANDGDEAVRMALEHRPDLIIMDMMLPKVDGFKATQIIKQTHDLKGITILALTARTGSYDEARSREAGCDDYITKPFRVNHLREKLIKYLGGEPSAAPHS